jgi:hypothetical protein
MSRFFRRKKEAIDPDDLKQAASTRGRLTTPSIQRTSQPVVTIQYVNLTADGRHGDIDKALDMAAATGKPIFANFVEWTW